MDREGAQGSYIVYASCFLAPLGHSISNTGNGELERHNRWLMDKGYSAQVLLFEVNRECL